MIKHYLFMLFFLLPTLLLAQESETQTQFPQQMSASRLLEVCTASALTRTGRERRRYCAGFVSGVEEAVRVLQKQHKLKATVCLPKGVTAKRLSDVFIKYSATHKQYMDKPAAAAVLAALMDAWPCKDSS